MTITDINYQKPQCSGKLFLSLLCRCALFFRLHHIPQAVGNFTSFTTALEEVSAWCDSINNMEAKSIGNLPPMMPG